MEIIIGFVCGALIVSIFTFLFFKLMEKKQYEQFKTLSESILKDSTGILGAQMKDYQEYINSIHLVDTKDRESLREKINSMLSSAKSIEVEAGQLSRALKTDVKFQGAWGELTLERILELSGLENGREYFTQNVYTSETGDKQRPDVIVNLPNNSCIIIDSKVSLTSYFYYYNDQDENALKLLRTSVLNHITSLAKKNYQNISEINSPEFVYMFIPVEGIYSLVLNKFPDLIDESLKKNVVLVSPVNLMANLKTVASLWRLEKQSKNAEEMAVKAGAMYDKFVALTDDIEKIGTHLKRAEDSRISLVNKLSTGKGNLIQRADELKSLGANTTKSLSN